MPSLDTNDKSVILNWSRRRVVCCRLISISSVPVRSVDPELRSSKFPSLTNGYGEVARLIGSWYGGRPGPL